VKRVQIDDSILDRPIDEIVRLWPESVIAFLAYRIDCIGCDYDRFHSLRTALDLYDIDADQFLLELVDSIIQTSGGKS
jgi:hybrid cluster-associated redox disulfide protein